MAEIENNVNVKTFADYIEDLTQEYEEPTPLLCLQDDNHRPTPVFTVGSLSVITGQAKSRKTFLATYLINLLFDNHGKDEKPFKILHIDTEQSRYYFRKTIARIYKMQMWNEKERNEQYIPLALKTCSFNDRRAFAEDAIKFYRPDFVLIDGAKDLIKDFNDQVECGAFAEDISRWCGIYQTHICNIVHENRGSEKVRGHLGAELTNKCETIMQVELIDDAGGVSLIKAKECRGMKFKPFSIRIVDGIPELYDAVEVLDNMGKETSVLNKIAELLKNKDYMYAKNIGECLISEGIVSKLQRAYDYIRRGVALGMFEEEADGTKKRIKIKTNNEENNEDEKLPF